MSKGIPEYLLFSSTFDSKTNGFDFSNLNVQHRKYVEELRKRPRTLAHRLSDTLHKPGRKGRNTSFQLKGAKDFSDYLKDNADGVLSATLRGYVFREGSTVGEKYEVKQDDLIIGWYICYKKMFHSDTDFRRKFRGEVVKREQTTIFLQRMDRFILEYDMRWDDDIEAPRWMRVDNSQHIPFP